jgi:hypothetical protein
MRFVPQAVASLLFLAGSAEGFGVALPGGRPSLSTTSTKQQQQYKPLSVVLQCSSHNHDHDHDFYHRTAPGNDDNELEHMTTNNNNNKMSNTRSGTINLLRRTWGRTHGMMEKAGLPNALEQIRNPLRNPIVFLIAVLAAKYLRAKFIMKVGYGRTG